MAVKVICEITWQSVLLSPVVLIYNDHTCKF